MFTWRCVGLVWALALYNQHYMVYTVYGIMAPSLQQPINVQLSSKLLTSDEMELKSEKDGKKSDCSSSNGVTMYLMLTKNPFNNDHQSIYQQLNNKIASENSTNEVVFRLIFWFLYTHRSI